MRTLAFLLAVVFLYVPAAWGQSIRVATYNLNWANRRGDEVLAAISTAKPDVICFQETTRQSERFLRDQLSDTYPYFHAVGHEGRYAAERFAFASKFELTELTFVPPDAGLFGFYHAELQFAGEAVKIVNVHLAPFVVRRGGGMWDAMEALSATEEIHATEMTAIEAVVDTQHPTIVLGDFNSLSDFNAPKRMVEMGFVDAYASIHQDADTATTWHWPTRPLPLAFRIDYIFHTRHFVATEAMVIRRRGSDHSLVVAELKLGEPPQVTEPVSSGASSPQVR